MSTITLLNTASLLGNRQLPQAEALEVYYTTPEAVQDYIASAIRRLIGVAPAHNHEADGGESLYPAIVSVSFDMYRDDNNNFLVGIPIGPRGTGNGSNPTITGSFASVTSNGIVDRTNGKKLFCTHAVIPGGVLGVRADVLEYGNGSDDITFSITIRNLNTVNYKLGVPTNEERLDFSYKAGGSFSIHFAFNNDLSGLGDPNYDREVEIALWLTCDIPRTNINRILSLAIVPYQFTPAPRAPGPNDLAAPELSVREVYTGIGSFSGNFANKVKEIYNTINRALWGTTPGLLPDLRSDTRRRFKETIEDCHRHMGQLVPDLDGALFADGAVLKDAQQISFIGSLGHSSNGSGISTESVILDGTPVVGQQLHPSISTTNTFSFRRSIPAGLGGLVFRLGIHPGLKALGSYDTTFTLLAEITAVAVDGTTGNIINRLYCGPYTSPLSNTDSDYGFVEVQPKDDEGFVTNKSLFAQGQKGFTLGAEIDLTTQLQTLMNDNLYRVSEPILAQLSYIPLRPDDDRHPTTDYTISIRLKVRNSAGDFDTNSCVLWVGCFSAPGF